MARIRLATVPTTTVPPTGEIAIYAKGDRFLYVQDENGIERLIFDSVSAIGTGYKVEYFTLDISDILSKSITLPEIPAFPERTLLTPDGGLNSFYGLDFTVAADVLSWSGLRLDGLLEPGDVLQVIYSV